MSWQKPITDRTLSDIQTKARKGLFDLADLTRLYDNLDWIKKYIPIYKYPEEFIIPEQRVNIFAYKTINNYEKNIYYLKELYGLSEFFPQDDFGSKELYGDFARKSLDYVKINQWEKILFYLKKFAYDSAKTWQDVYDNHASWQNVYQTVSRWGDLLI